MLITKKDGTVEEFNKAFISLSGYLPDSQLTDKNKSST